LVSDLHATIIAASVGGSHSRFWARTVSITATLRAQIRP
jgi:hypothetical protein